MTHGIATVWLPSRTVEVLDSLNVQMLTTSLMTCQKPIIIRGTHEHNGDFTKHPDCHLKPWTSPVMLSRHIEKIRDTALFRIPDHNSSGLRHLCENLGYQCAICDDNVTFSMPESDRRTHGVLGSARGDDDNPIWFGRRRGSLVQMSLRIGRRHLFNHMLKHLHQPSVHFMFCDIV
jgi:hypothetical protein